MSAFSRARSSAIVNEHLRRNLGNDFYDPFKQHLAYVYDDESPETLDVLCSMAVAGVGNFHRHHCVDNTGASTNSTQ